MRTTWPYPSRWTEEGRRRDGGRTSNTALDYTLDPVGVIAGGDIKIGGQLRNKGKPEVNNQ